VPHSRPVQNIEELTAILTAIDESIATNSCPTIEVSDVEATAHWLKRNQWDVDWDNIDGVITVFGDRPSESDEPESWVFRLSERVTA
jgi:hypothetical protein